MMLPRAAVLGSEFGTTPDTKPKARLDGVGIWWLTYAGVWTLLLATGMTFLYKKRNTPTLRLRGLSLTFAGIVLLHLYWLTVQIAYSVGPLAPEVAEYWIMGLWYPFGIALFQAGNSQFLHVAKAQGRFARPPSQMKTRFDEKRLPRKSTFMQRLKAMDYSKRMFMFVTMGMGVQLVVVVIVYMISRKFHPDFGIPGTEVYGSTPMEIAMKQGRGWEWIALSILAIEVCTVFIPCWQVCKHQNLRQETLESIANWESKKRFGAKTEASSDRSTAPPLSPTSTKVGESHGFDAWKKLSSLEANHSQPSVTGVPDESVLTMAALEHVLEKNPEPLRQFSARRDFSGENIAFLTAVAEWKAALPQDFLCDRHDTTPDTVREQFTRALRIYTEFISPREAEFPINIAWADLRKLQGIFERAARHAAEANPPRPPATTQTPHLPTQSTKATSPSFSASVFDAAQASIKYLVLTNTWPKACI
ncbi:hypothetical protein N0V88_007934 [Collariella sp. IMI 366227]|nr:hypothetical protein N0V88_007934 [Collariella sp. IMI 366227]